MAGININSNVSDDFYRYKMPRLIAKVEGKGNGIKTVIPNMVEIAKALNRPPSYTTKFFGCELGAQTQVDLKNERYIVNGAHEAEKLQQILDLFIKKFVLCPGCENPETDLNIRRDSIKQVCKACGANSDINMVHKLCGYILKNPPNEQGTSTKGGKKERRRKKAHENGNATAVADTADTADSPANGPDGGLAEETSEPPVVEGEWESMGEEDLDEEMTDAAKALIDGVRPERERVDEFFRFVSTCVQDGNLKTGPLKERASRLNVSNQAPLVLVEVLFSPCKTPRDLLTAINKHSDLLMVFCSENQLAQHALLEGLEKLVTDDEHCDAFMKYTARFLQAIYQLDLVVEDVFNEWYNKSSKKRKRFTEVREAASVFINWLAEAEEETDDEDEDEDEDEDDKKPPTTSVDQLANGVASISSKSATAAAATSKPDDDSDIDIDDI